MAETHFQESSTPLYCLPSLFHYLLLLCLSLKKKIERKKKSNRDMDSTSPPQWSSLPSDLLFNIASILGTRIDLLSLRAVCNSWRSSLSLPPKTPLVKLPFPIDPNNPNLNPNRHGHFALSESFSYSLEPINRDPKRTWLI